MNHERVLGDLERWIRGDENIRAAVLTGSLARGEGDALSDIDLELIVQDPAPLLATDDWYHCFGEVLAVEALANAGWNPTRLVYYVDGKIDFTILSCRDARRTDAAQRAARVLVDKDALVGDLASEVVAPSRPPTQAEFDTCVNWFSAAAIMAAKCIARGELWSAKVRDIDAKAQLLRIIEWDHKSRYGWSYDTWHNAAHMYDWMDADITAELEQCWSALAADASATALLATVALFNRLATRAATTLALTPFPVASVAAEVRRILNAVYG